MNGGIIPIKPSVKTYADALQSPQVYRTVSASTIDTVDITVPVSDSKMLVGFAVEAALDVVPLQFYFTSDTNIHVRVRNLSNASQTYQIRALYI